ncbi:unnamed protein product [Musa acuminata var. zebrina]
MIIGFHGRSGWYIDSVSVHALKGKVPSTYEYVATKYFFCWNQNTFLFFRRAINSILLKQIVYTGLIKEPTPSRPGHWGGDGEVNHGMMEFIQEPSKVHITRGDAINSVQIEYDRSGQSVWSVRHGSSGETSHQVKFDYPNEILNRISGYTAPSTMAIGSRS